LNHAAVDSGIPRESATQRVGINHITSLRDPESKHYNLYEFEREKREAFGRWAAEIEKIIQPAAVVPIRAARGRRR